MWSKEYVDQLRTYCDLNHGIDIGVYASFLESALDEIESLQAEVEQLKVDLETSWKESDNLDTKIVDLMQEIDRLALRIKH